MKISELTNELHTIQAKYGDLPILGGYIGDDSGMSEVVVLDKDGCDVVESGKDAEGVFFQ